MNKKINCIIMGGTYNPVHIGHLHLIDEIQKEFRPEIFFIIPSNISAHKIDKRIISAVHRLKMLEIACRDLDVVVEDCEIKRKGVSYSIDTIRYIKEKYNLEEKPGFVIGDDLAAGFAEWRDPELVAEESELIIAHRGLKSSVNDFKYSYSELDNMLLEISSSDIRKRISEHRACRYLLPHGVYEYIVSNKLYGDSYV